jgi:hypothetical protein
MFLEQTDGVLMLGDGYYLQSAHTNTPNVKKFLVMLLMEDESQGTAYMEKVGLDGSWDVAMNGISERILVQKKVVFEELRFKWWVKNVLIKHGLIAGAQIKRSDNAK